jgi:hypothetical protein
MKISSNKEVTSFKPVDIIITCETQEELDRLSALFNYSPIMEFLVNDGESGLFIHLKKAGGDINKYFDKLKEMIGGK